MMGQVFSYNASKASLIIDDDLSPAAFAVGAFSTCWLVYLVSLPVFARVAKKGASAAQAATSGAMSVSQACTFFAANPTIDEAEKSAFLKSKGVSDFVIAQAICTSTGMEKTVAGHP